MPKCIITIFVTPLVPLFSPCVWLNKFILNIMLLQQKDFIQRNFKTPEYSNYVRFERTLTVSCIEKYKYKFNNTKSYQFIFNV